MLILCWASIVDGFLDIHQSSNVNPTENIYTIGRGLHTMFAFMLGRHFIAYANYDTTLVECVYWA